MGAAAPLARKRPSPRLLIFQRPASPSARSAREGEVSAGRAPHLLARFARGGRPRGGRRGSFHHVFTGAVSFIAAIARKPATIAPVMYQAGASGEPVTSISQVTIYWAEPPNTATASA